jgi:alkanesulfonate monooxygenase SsuD/methylene tetrahydromethanopterin reductase-like flavin-dependent oxidoreductase (luciferase family)
VQQPHPPILVGGYGRRVLQVAAESAQIVQFTGLAHDADGTPRPRGFAKDTLAERVGWLQEAAGERLDALELSVLVQRVHEGDPATEAAAIADRFGMDADVVRTSPFLLFGSVDAMVEQLLEQREAFGISYVTVREAELFAPVVARLAGT